MKQYTEKDIKVVDWEKHVRENPSMYFDESRITPETLRKAIEYTALKLGAKYISITQIDNWCYFSAEHDWLLQSNYKFKSISQIFTGPGPFPEAKQLNAFRTESLLLPFSSDAYTISKEEMSVLKGKAPDQSTIEKHLRNLGKWARVIGCKLNA